MAAQRDVRVGRPIPDVSLAELVDGHLAPVFARDVMARGRVLVVGVPGAFTPVCSNQHLPDLIASADKLYASGFSSVICVVASDPFVVSAWAKSVDPERRIRFLSDGNLDFARELNVISNEHRLFLGERSERYVMALRNGVVETFRLERSISDYSCTNADAFILEDA